MGIKGGWKTILSVPVVFLAVRANDVRQRDAIVAEAFRARFDRHVDRGLGAVVQASVADLASVGEAHAAFGNGDIVCRADLRAYTRR